MKARAQVILDDAERRHLRCGWERHDPHLHIQARGCGLQILRVGFVQHGKARDDDGEAIHRVPAHAIEDRVRQALSKLGQTGEGWPVARVEVHPTTVQILIRRAAFFRKAADPDAELQTLQRRLGVEGRLAHDAGDGDLLRLTLDCRLSFTGGRVSFDGTSLSGRAAQASLGSHPDKWPAHGASNSCVDGGVAGAARDPCGRPDASSTHHRRLACLALLAPDIQAQILEGRHPPASRWRGSFQGGYPSHGKTSERPSVFPAGELRPGFEIFPASGHCLPCSADEIPCSTRCRELRGYPPLRVLGALKFCRGGANRHPGKVPFKRQPSCRIPATGGNSSRSPAPGDPPAFSAGDGLQCSDILGAWCRFDGV